MDLTTRVSLVQNLLTTKEIPASVGARLLDINRTSIYYKGKPVSDEELADELEVFAISDGRYFVVEA